MKSNHISVIKRLENKIGKLQYRLEDSRENKKGNPYWYCKYCNIYDPELYNSQNDGRHRKNCPIQGLEKQIAYYKELLAKEKLIINN